MRAAHFKDDEIERGAEVLLMSSWTARRVYRRRVLLPHVPARQQRRIPPGLANVAWWAARVFVVLATVNLLWWLTR
jgi:hypothetical protein